MKTLAFVLAFFVLAFFLQGYSNREEAACPSMSQLTPIETEDLKQMVLNNHFLSGCVTELISDLSERACENCKNQCKTNFDKTLSYIQWTEIYTSCRVK